MPDLPSGTVTFLFTDIEGSTALWERDRAAMTAAVDRHIALLDAAIEAHGGIHYKTVGDAVQAATGFTGVLDDQQVAPIVTALRTALGEEALAVAWGTGRRLSWADATANALALVNELTPRDEPGNVV